MKCVDNNPLTSAMLYQSLGEVSDTEIQAHLERCPYCRHQLETLRQLEIVVQQNVHPSAHHLLEYVEGTANAAQHAFIQEHLSFCAECRAIVDDLQTLPDQMDIMGMPISVITAERRVIQAIYRKPLNQTDRIKVAGRTAFEFQDYYAEGLTIKLKTQPQGDLVELSGRLLSEDDDWELAHVAATDLDGVTYHTEVNADAKFRFTVPNSIYTLLIESTTELLAVSIASIDTTEQSP
jgi:hypothetical protein